MCAGGYQFSSIEDFGEIDRPGRNRISRCDIDAIDEILLRDALNIDVGVYASVRCTSANGIIMPSPDAPQGATG